MGETYSEDRERYTIFSPETEAKIGDLIARTFLVANQNQVVDPNDPVSYTMRCGCSDLIAGCIAHYRSRKPSVQS